MDAAKVNIVQINTTSNRGGAARVMHRLHQAYNGKAHSASALVRSRVLNSDSIFTVAEVTGKKSAATGHMTNRVMVKLDEWFDLPGVHQATRAVLNTPLFQAANVLHLHNLHGRYFNYGLLPTVSMCKPTVWTLHDMWALTGHCAYAYDCKRWQTQCHHCPLLRGTNRQLVEPRPTQIDRSRAAWRRKQRLYAQSRLHVVTPSRWLSSLARRSILANALSIQCIPNGVDLRTFKPMEQRLARHLLGIPVQAKVIMFVAARVSHQRKGFVYLQELLARLPDNEAIFLLTVGDSAAPGGAFDRFDHRALGYVNDEHLIRLAYCAADLFVFPTLADNQPLVLAEALACGTPIVSFDVGGVPEMVRHLETGYLARYRDRDDLYRGVSTLLDNQPLRLQMRQQCRKIAEREFDLQLQVDRHLALYQQAIDAHQAPE